MEIRKYLCGVALVLSLSTISACQTPDLNRLKESSIALLSSDKMPKSKVLPTLDEEIQSIDKLLMNSLADKNSGSDYATIIKSAIDGDPSIKLKRLDADAKWAAVGATEARKEFQVSGTVYGGIEDVTDGTRGVAVSLNASRSLFDGGLLDAEILAKRYAAESAELGLRAAIDERAFRLGVIWLELEKYQSLKEQIDSRLAILDPLIEQLEKVAKAGVGDVSKVTAAQRTVSTIRVTQSGILEGLESARLDFANAFGSVNDDVKYDSEFVVDLIPEQVVEEMAQRSPLILSQYADYNSALARVAALRAKDDFNIGFEARATKPFAGSEYDSDESIGLVARKTLFTGGMIESEIKEAEALVEAGEARIKATYREGSRTILSAQQNIFSMNKAIELARNNAELTEEEIVYLRQQLIIGGSTLESVLSAEARLYEAESQEINFTADKLKSELLIASTLGLLGPALGF
mgnify:CR=1 FL=1